LGGDQPLHDVLLLIFQSLIKDPTTSIMISISRICLRVSLAVLSLPRHSYHYMPTSLMPLLQSGAVSATSSPMSTL
jgi:hypothetical protein